MIIVDSDTEDSGVDQVTDRVSSYVAGLGGRVANEDRWGRRRFAYEINHKSEGIYTVLEFVTPGGDLAPLERTLRLADEVVRHKLIRLPEKEAIRRELFGESTSPTGESEEQQLETEQPDITVQPDPPEQPEPDLSGHPDAPEQPEPDLSGHPDAPERL